ncbi:uncharacterized protein LOC143285866 [Babylonia areolata]|uniref:uncharacterized protein LOC143285866 n=1 Tax=Babylonia areolata TaxID=304850 RepID=UPI003FD64ED0
MASKEESAASSPAANGKVSASFPKLQKLTYDDICFRVLPTVGGVSYGYFAIHIMNTSWFKSVFHNNDVRVANTFWFNAHVGIGLYMFGSSHLRQAPINRRILYSVFGSFLFNFGSVLFWATSKTFLPAKPGLLAMFGLASGFVLLYVGKEYVDYIDSCKKADGLS